MSHLYAAQWGREVYKDKLRTAQMRTMDGKVEQLMVLVLCSND